MKGVAKLYLPHLFCSQTSHSLLAIQYFVPPSFSALSLTFAHCLRIAAPLWQPRSIIAKIS